MREGRFRGVAEVAELFLDTTGYLAALRHLDEANAVLPLCRTTWRGEIFMLWHRTVNFQGHGPLRRTRLMHAAMRNDVRRIRELIAHGALTDLYDTDGWTALHWAVTTGAISAVEELLERGAKCDYNSIKLLRVAKGQLLSIGLKEEAEELDRPSRYMIYDCPLGLAVHMGQVATVKLMLERGGDPNGRGYWWTGIFLGEACRQGYLDVVRLLLDAGASLASPTPPSMYLERPLYHALRGGDAGVIELLRARGAEECFEHVESLVPDRAAAMAEYAAECAAGGDEGEDEAEDYTDDESEGEAEAAAAAAEAAAEAAAGDDDVE